MGFELPDRSILPKHAVIVGDSMIERGTGQAIAHIYPANGQATCELSLGGASDVGSAVQAARDAFPSWRAMSGEKRRDLLLKIAGLIEQHGSELSALATLENGSPAMAASYIPPVAAQRFSYYAGWADKIRGATLNAWGGAGPQLRQLRALWCCRCDYSLEWAAVRCGDGDGAGTGGG